ncbi:MAG: hypothetical protein WCJ17_04365 [bacterium]
MFKHMFLKRIFIVLAVVSAQHTLLVSQPYHQAGQQEHNRHLRSRKKRSVVDRYKALLISLAAVAGVGVLGCGAHMYTKQRARRAAAHPRNNPGDPPADRQVGPLHDQVGPLHDHGAVQLDPPLAGAAGVRHDFVDNTDLLDYERLPASLDHMNSLPEFRSGKVSDEDRELFNMAKRVGLHSRRFLGPNGVMHTGHPVPYPGVTSGIGANGMLDGARWNQRISGSWAKLFPIEGLQALITHVVESNLMSTSTFSADALISLLPQMNVKIGQGLMTYGSVFDYLEQLVSAYVRGVDMTQYDGHENTNKLDDMRTMFKACYWNYLIGSWFLWSSDRSENAWSCLFELYQSWPTRSQPYDGGIGKFKQDFQEFIPRNDTNGFLQLLTLGVIKNEQGNIVRLSLDNRSIG